MRENRYVEVIIKFLVKGDGAQDAVNLLHKYSSDIRCYRLSAFM